MKFSIKDFFSKCDQIRSFLRILSHLLKKSLMENFIFCVHIAKAYFRYTIWFMFSEKSITRCAFLRIGARVYQNLYKTYKKTEYQNFQFFQPLKITFIWATDFYRYKHVYTYTKEEFQNILERKLCKCFE